MAGWRAVDIRGGLDIRTRLHQDLWAEITTLTDCRGRLGRSTHQPQSIPSFDRETSVFLVELNIFEFGQRGAAQPFFCDVSDSIRMPIRSRLARDKLYGQTDRGWVSQRNNGQKC